jgi:hypothetical protein
VLKPVVEVEKDPGSFRDPSGGVVTSGGRVFRHFNSQAGDQFRILLQTDALRRLNAAGKLIDSTIVSPEEAPEVYAAAEDVGLVVEHSRVPFLSYAYEWPFEMLKAAAECQLEVTAEALAAGYLVKDATPFNVQFFGVRPTFIDVASLEPYEAGRPWLGYSQFCRMFLNPLLLQAYAGVPFQPWLRGALEGIEIDHLRRLIPLRHKLRKGVFLDVVMQSWLNHRFAGSQRMARSIANQKIPGSAVEGLIRRMTRQIRGLKRRSEGSPWSDYEDSKSHYSPEDERFKEAFVREALDRARPRTTWDLGCNRGQYSLLAAGYSDYVVAMDFDEASVGGLYERIAGKVDNVLPLVIDLMNPSPSLGWAGKERRGLHERGQPEFALSLALVHHLAISGNVPLGMICSWLASVAGKGVVEFVPKSDPMVQRLLATRKDVYPDYAAEHFEGELEGHFRIMERKTLPDSGRILYALTRR